MSSYGSWKSPLTSEGIASSTVSLGSIKACPQGNIHWVESRPIEKGRCVITTFDEKKSDKKDIGDSKLNSVSTVHEYGGNAYTILNDGRYVSCDATDGNLYLIGKDNKRTAITQQPDGDAVQFLYMDPFQNPENTNQIFAIREQHSPKAGFRPESVQNCLVCIDTQTCTQRLVAAGNACFYSSPRVNVKGEWLAFVSWNHPNMPWDQTSLYVAALDPETGAMTGQTLVENGASIMSPKWSLDRHTLYYVSDRNGWWELMKYDAKTNKSEPVLKETMKDHEFGFAEWGSGSYFYDLLDGDTIFSACVTAEDGTSKLFKISNIKAGKATIEQIKLNDKIQFISELVIDRNSRQLYFLGGGPTTPNAIFVYDIDKQKMRSKPLVASIPEAKKIDSKYISIPEAISFETSNNDFAHAYIYPPKNDDYKTSDSDRPPLVVFSHGGPTASTNTVYYPAILFFTTRGWMVADVNYRGSTGFGTEYRNKLKMNWGVFDKDDCCGVVEYLKKEDKINPKQVAIRGGSAGGYTTLCCLTFEDCFNIGCSLYGVGDIRLLLKDTHKFESEYMYGLMGYDKQVYIDRAPVEHAELVKCPVIFLHGTEDTVVPIEQAETMHDALMDNKITTCLEKMEGEGHGFKMSENIIAATDYEYRFYCELLGITLSKQDEEQMKKPTIDYGDPQPTRAAASGSGMMAKAFLQ